MDKDSGKQGTRRSGQGSKDMGELMAVEYVRRLYDYWRVGRQKRVDCGRVVFKIGDGREEKGEWESSCVCKKASADAG